MTGGWRQRRTVWCVLAALLISINVLLHEWQVNTALEVLDEILDLPQNKKQSGASSSELKTIVMVTVGSRGDIQPLFAVALALRARGHRVRMVTSTAYADDMNKQGLDALGVYDDPQTIIKSDKKMVERMTAGDAIGFLWCLKNLYERLAPRVAKTLISEMELEKPDLVITTYTGEYAGWAAAKLYGIPYVNLALYSLSYNPDFMQFGYPTLPFGLHYYILRDGILSFYYYCFTPFDKFLGANVMSQLVHRRQFTKSVLEPTRPIIHLMSPQFQPILAPNAPAQFQWAGNTIVEPRFLITNTTFGGDGNITEMEHFINESPNDKPIYLGWGSMTVHTPQWMTLLAVRAARYANKRAIVLGGGAGLGYERLLENGGGVADEDLLRYARENVMFVKAAPHEWLFPRVACTVHHGGAGTTVAALRAGTPTVVTPIFFDNFDNSYLVRGKKLGAGFTKRFANTSWKEVGEAIVKVIADEEIQKNLNKLSDELLKEDGAMEAAKLIEKFWDEWCATGKFFEHFLELEPEPSCNYIALQGVVFVWALWYFEINRLRLYRPGSSKKGS